MLRQHTDPHCILQRRTAVRMEPCLARQRWAVDTRQIRLLRHAVHGAYVVKPRQGTIVSVAALEPSTTPVSTPVIPGDYSKAVLMQAFGWDSCMKGGWYKQVSSKVADIQAAGVTHLWLPPPSQSVSPQGYMPGQLYNLNSKYGTQEELLALTKALQAAGIQPMADIVINHRCADEQVDGVWNKFRDDINHEGKRIDWGQWAITSNDPSFKGSGNPDTGEDYGPAPDLDHANPELRAALTDWLAWLQRSCGFQGWRLDFVKGYGARYVREYIAATTTENSLNVGEFWVDMRWRGSELDADQDAARQRLVDWINANGKSCCAFDFPTKGIVQEAAKKTQYWRLKDSQGRAPGLIGFWPSRAVTFVDNHDTGSSQQHWPFPRDLVALGYAYCLTHPGMPCIFWEHYFDWGSGLRTSIAQLAALRHRQGLHSRSKLQVLCAEADMYVACIDGKVTVKLGPRFDMGALVPSSSQGWKLAVTGKDFAVWEKAA
ncbi:glycoside hydrolase superfamily [Haematococcus lacustris]